MAEKLGASFTLRKTPQHYFFKIYQLYNFTHVFRIEKKLKNLETELKNENRDFRTP